MIWRFKRRLRCSLHWLKSLVPSAWRPRKASPTIKLFNSSHIWASILASICSALMINLWPMFYLWWLIHRQVELVAKKMIVHLKTKLVCKQWWPIPTRSMRNSLHLSSSESRSCEFLVNRTSPCKIISLSLELPSISCRSLSITWVSKGKNCRCARILSSGTSVALSSQE